MEPTFVVVTDSFIVPVSEIFIFEQALAPSQLNVRTPQNKLYLVYEGTKEDCEKILATIGKLDKNVFYLRRENIANILAGKLLVKIRK